jgi:hypothetical protein
MRASPEAVSPHVLQLRYEDVLMDETGVIHRIASSFGLPKPPDEIRGVNREANPGNTFGQSYQRPSSPFRRYDRAENRALVVAGKPIFDPDVLAWLGYRPE